jgi:hypothetical protein
MQSTFDVSSLIGKDYWVGADLTDRYARTPRPIDVCWLAETEDATFLAYFGTWDWGPSNQRVDASSLLLELKGARGVALDGPQGLAAQSKSMRECERQLGAAGKTPDARPSGNRPFAGYINSSLDLFAALAAVGLELDDVRTGAVAESYPGACWAPLTSSKLDKKDTVEGRRQRWQVLQAFGVSAGNVAVGIPTHDQLDAAIGALLSAAKHDRVRNLKVDLVGTPGFADASGLWREGRILVPKPAKRVELTRAADARRVPVDPAKAAHQVNSPGKTGEFQEVDCVVWDHSNLWRSSGGKVLNPWLVDTDDACWEVEFIAERLRVRFVPFQRATGAAGVKPHPDYTESWHKISAGTHKGAKKTLRARVRRIDCAT